MGLFAAPLCRPLPTISASSSLLCKFFWALQKIFPALYDKLLPERGENPSSSKGFHLLATIYLLAFSFSFSFEQQSRIMCWEQTKPRACLWWEQRASSPPSRENDGALSLVAGEQSWKSTVSFCEKPRNVPALASSDRKGFPLKAELQKNGNRETCLQG